VLLVAGIEGLVAEQQDAIALAAIVIAGELALGVPHGIALGAALSLSMLIYRTSHPQGAALGQLPGEEAYRDIRRHPEAITFPGLLIWRIGGDLFFASIGHLNERLKAAPAASRLPARHVLVDADSVNFIDTSACDARLNSIKDLQSQGIKFAFARVARRGTRANAAGRHRGCRRVDQLSRTCYGRRARLATDKRATRSNRRIGAYCRALSGVASSPLESGDSPAERSAPDFKKDSYNE
jgi:MFS superfamily sulfate permease-like transporter